jgi:DNA-binding CsgD family transcriptional regulator
MAKIFNLDHHISITSSNQVAKIIEPLVDAFKISYFRYLKVFHDGSRIALSNNPDGIRHGYEEGNYKDMWFDGEFPQFLREGWHSWRVSSLLDTREEQMKIEVEECLKNLLKVSEGVTFIQSGMTYYEVFSFDTNEKSIYSIDKKLLMRFILYFKDKANKIIQRSESEKIIIPNKCIQAYGIEQKNKDVLKFLNETKINRYHLSGKYENVYLTATEARCLYWLAVGKTAEEIGMIENNSVRTVQTHLENIKMKLNCQKQTQLVAAALEIGIIDVLTN